MILWARREIETGEAEIFGPIDHYKINQAEALVSELLDIGIGESVIIDWADVIAHGRYPIRNAIRNYLGHPFSEPTEEDLAFEEDQTSAF